jgi:hypothetical protein
MGGCWPKKTRLEHRTGNQAEPSRRWQGEEKTAELQQNSPKRPDYELLTVDDLPDAELLLISKGMHPK